MPPITRWHIKLSFLYLIAALAMGIVDAAHADAHGTLFAPYVHLLVVGWITQMVFGVAYWMFPKGSKEQPRGSSLLAAGALLLLNLGLLFRVVFEPLASRARPPSTGWILVTAAATQWLAGVAFVLNTWPRVKER